MYSLDLNVLALYSGPRVCVVKQKGLGFVTDGENSNKLTLLKDVSSLLRLMDRRKCGLVLDPLSNISDYDLQDLNRLSSNWTAARGLYGVFFTKRWIETAKINHKGIHDAEIVGESRETKIEMPFAAGVFLRGRGYDCDGLIERGFAIERSVYNDLF